MFFLIVNSSLTLNKLRMIFCFCYFLLFNMLFAGKMLIIKTLKTSNVLNMVILYSQLEIFKSKNNIFFSFFLVIMLRVVNSSIQLQNLIELSLFSFSWKSILPCHCTFLTHWKPKNSKKKLIEANLTVCKAKAP